MRVRTSLLVVAAAIAASLPPQAQAAAPRPYLPMAVITVTGDTTRGGRLTIDAGFPAGWSCASGWDFDTRTFDAWCFPPAPPPGFYNACAWVVSATTAGFPVSLQGAPTTVSSCNTGLTAVSGGSPSVPVGLAVPDVSSTNPTSLPQLTALRCRVLAPNTPPETGFSSNCNANH